MGTPRVAVLLTTSFWTVGQWDTVTLQRPARGARLSQLEPGDALRAAPALPRVKKGRHVISVRRHLTKNRLRLTQKSLENSLLTLHLELVTVRVKAAWLRETRDKDPKTDQKEREPGNPKGGDPKTDHEGGDPKTVRPLGGNVALSAGQRVSTWDEAPDRHGKYTEARPVRTQSKCSPRLTFTHIAALVGRFGVFLHAAVQASPWTLAKRPPNCLRRCALLGRGSAGPEAPAKKSGACRQRHKTKPCVQRQRMARIARFRKIVPLGCRQRCATILTADALAMDSALLWERQLQHGALRQSRRAVVVLFRHLWLLLILWLLMSVISGIPGDGRFPNTKEFGWSCSR